MGIEKIDQAIKDKILEIETTIKKVRENFYLLEENTTQEGFRILRELNKLKKDYEKVL